MQRRHWQVGFTTGGARQGRWMDSAIQGPPVASPHPQPSMQTKWNERGCRPSTAFKQRAGGCLAPHACTHTFMVRRCVKMKRFLPLLAQRVPRQMQLLWPGAEDELRGCLVHPKFQTLALCKKKITVTSNLRYMYGVLNVDEIKN